MVKLINQLELSQCPHCNVSSPNLIQSWSTHTTDHSGRDSRFWKIYKCNSCGGLVTAFSLYETGSVEAIYPKSTNLDEAIPPKARAYLDQALNSLSSPAGSVMLCASSIDAMLKEKGYKIGNLYDRIDKAAKDHLITDGMSKWAHEVRLEANDQRHADDEAELPNETDARRCIDFALALADFIFIIPSRVTRGIEESKEKNQP